MQEQQNNTAKRIVLASILIAAAAFLIFANREIRRGVTYSFEEPQVNILADSDAQSDVDRTPLSSIEEQEDLNHVIHLTVGGNCTPAAVLGTNSFGSFNRMAEEDGAHVFFADLNEVFAEDDLTVLGCAAVLSDSEIYYEDSASDELPYIGPLKNAHVFSSGGEKILSLEHERCKLLGEIGVSETKNAVESAGFYSVDSENAVFFEKYGVTVGVLSAAIPPHADVSVLTESVTSAAEACDYLILYAERYEAEENYYISLAKTFVDAGCELVCYTGYTDGTEPEILAYNNGVIVDSLGYLLDGSTYEGADTALYCLSLSVNEGVLEKTEGALVPVTYGENPWIPLLKK